MESPTACRLRRVAGRWSRRRRRCRGVRGDGWADRLYVTFSRPFSIAARWAHRRFGVETLVGKAAQSSYGAIRLRSATSWRRSRVFTSGPLWGRHGRGRQKSSWISVGGVVNDGGDFEPGGCRRSVVVVGARVPVEASRRGRRPAPPMGSPLVVSRSGRQVGRDVPEAERAEMRGRKISDTARGSQEPLRRRAWGPR